MRLIACLLVYGIPADKKKEVFQRITEVIQVTYQHPALTAFVSTLVGIFECVMTIRPFKCITSTSSFLFSIGSEFKGIIGDAFVAFGHVTGMWNRIPFVRSPTDPCDSDRCRSQPVCSGFFARWPAQDPDITLEEMTFENANHLGKISMILKGATLGYVSFEEGDAEHLRQLEIASFVVPVYREMRNFTSMTMSTMGMSIALWILRSVPIDLFLGFLKHQPFLLEGREVALTLEKFALRSIPPVGDGLLSSSTTGKSMRDLIAMLMATECRRSHQSSRSCTM